jgi:hypothetical protein
MTSVKSEEPMKQMDISQIVADTHYAQILLKGDYEIANVHVAKSIIEQNGVRIVAMEYLSNQSVLFKVDVKDIRELVLKLTQNGFLRVEGYNALRGRRD